MFSRASSAKSHKAIEEVVGAEDVIEENEEVSMPCDEASVNDVALNGEESANDESLDEVVVEKEEVVEAKSAVNLNHGKSCRLKTEGEKLSKIIRKAGKEKEDYREERVTKSEKHRKIKRDTRNYDKHPNQHKKSVKSTGDQKKSYGRKQRQKSNQKSSKKHQRNKQSSKTEL